MNLRYGKADENVLKRSVADVILHERQKIAAYDELKKNKQNEEKINEYRLRSRPGWS